MDIMERKRRIILFSILTILFSAITNIKNRELIFFRRMRARNIRIKYYVFELLRSKD